MNLFFRKILLVFCCFFVFVHTNGQVNFYSVISPAEINKDEYFTYRIVIENASTVQQIVPPSFKNFNLVSEPIEEHGKNTVNGNTTQFVSLVFTLKPKRPGKFNIDASFAVINGKKYKGNLTSLSVINAVSGNTSSSNAFSGFDPFTQQRPTTDFKDYIFHKGDIVADKVNKNMQLRLEVDKMSCFVGEPIIATYKLYTRLKSESKLVQNPSFNGFSVIDMQQADITDYAREKLNGKEYNVYTIRKAQLYPLQPGVINLESAELENNIQFIKDEYAKKEKDINSLFNDFAGSIFPPDAVINQTVNLKSLPVNITVKPLPEENKPATFNGAVGSFSIDAHLQKNNFSTDEPGKLTVSISGNGNMQLITAPDIEWPSGIESFEPKVFESLVNTTVPISGSKTFEYSFATDVAANYTIPVIHFSYFDPVTGSYKSIATEPIVFKVIKGTGIPFSVEQGTGKPEKISFINSIFHHRSWIIIFLAAVLLTGLIFWLIKEKKPANDHHQSQLSKEAHDLQDQIIEASAVNQQNVLTESEKCLQRDDCFEFYVLLSHELKHYLSAKFSLDVNAINSNSITAVLDKKGISNYTALQLQQIMQDIEWQLYTPYERNEKMDALYLKAQEIIQGINAFEIRHL